MRTVSEKLLRRLEVLGGLRMPDTCAVFTVGGTRAPRGGESLDTDASGERARRCPHAFFSIVRWVRRHVLTSGTFSKIGLKAELLGEILVIYILKYQTFFQSKGKSLDVFLFASSSRSVGSDRMPVTPT